MSDFGREAQTNVDANTGSRISGVLQPPGVDLNFALNIIAQGQSKSMGFSKDLHEKMKATVKDQRKLIRAANSLSSSTDPVDLWTTTAQLGMTSLCIYNIFNCDTHSNSETAMFSGNNAHANHAFRVATNVIEQATQKGFVDDLMIVFTSEFCRTLTFNNSNGTQHNQNAQALIWAGNNFNLRYPAGTFGRYASSFDERGNAGGRTHTSSHLHNGLKHLWGMNHNNSALYGADA